MIGHIGTVEPSGRLNSASLIPQHSESTTEMTVHILDSALINWVGHCYEYDLAIYQELIRRGITCRIYASRRIEEDQRSMLNAVPWFRSIFYERITGSGKIGTVLDMFLHNYHFFCDLAKLDIGRFEKEDLIFVHTIDFRQFPALLLWYCTHLGYRGVKLAVLLRFGRPENSSKNRWLQVGNLYDLSLRAVPRKLQNAIVILSDSEELAKQEDRRLKREVKVLPIPHLPASEGNLHTIKKASCEFFIPGVPRIDKGFHLLPESLGDLLAMQVDCRFVIQCNVPRSLDARLHLAVEELEKLKGDITLIRDELSTSDYYRYLRSADCVLLPYNPKTYAARTSGVFSEALALGKTVVTPKGTWMSRQLETLGVRAPLMAEHSASSLVKACREYLDMREAYDAEFFVAASRWRQLHNPSRFIDLLFAACGVKGNC